MPDPALVSALTLLFSNYERAAVARAYYEATKLPEREQRRLVCSTCGTDNISFSCDATWEKTQGMLILGEADKCWCEECGGETHDSEVESDYIRPK
jgi:hypothetical protein